MMICNKTFPAIRPILTILHDFNIIYVTIKAPQLF